MRICLRPLASSALFLTACGGAASGPQSAANTSPVPLLPSIAYPSCFTAPPADASAPVPDQTVTQILAATRQMADFQTALALQEAELLLTPVRKDPTASSWHVLHQRLDGSVVMRSWEEGAVLARGEEWAVLKMVFTDGGEHTIEATIDALPGRMIFDFGADQLEVRPNLVRLGKHIIGCDQEVGMSFEVGPGIVDGKLVADHSSCWSPSTGMSWVASGTTAQQQGYAASFDLQCAQLIAKNIETD
jgi:hypothetical protein